MNIEISKHSTASKAFGLRKQVRDCLLSAQTTEHDYYKKIGEQVESTATHLCEFFSQMIQDQMPSWQETKLQLFSSSADIAIANLHDWCGAYDRLINAGKMLTSSEETVKRRKTELSNFSGTLWGAKKGMEAQFASASSTLQSAESSHLATLDKFKIANAEAVKCARMVLEHCMSHAIKIAQCPIFGPDIKSFIAKAAQAASQSQRDHNHQQMRAIEDAQSALNALKFIYESK